MFEVRVPDGSISYFVSSYVQSACAMILYTHLSLKKERSCSSLNTKMKEEVAVKPRNKKPKLVNVTGLLEEKKESIRRSIREKQLFKFSVHTRYFKSWYWYNKTLYEDIGKWRRSEYVESMPSFEGYFKQLPG